MFTNKLTYFRYHLWKTFSALTMKILPNLESEAKETIIDQNEGVEHIFKFNHAKEF